MSAWAEPAAHISAVCSRQLSLALTLAPARTSRSATGTEPVRAVSINGVWSSSLASLTSARALISSCTSSALASLAASASGVAPSELFALGFAPCLSSSRVSSGSTLYTAQCSGVEPSPCATLTSAPARTAASAASRSPPRIRRQGPHLPRPDRCRNQRQRCQHHERCSATHDFGLHDLVGQRVVVRPHALVRVIDELVRDSTRCAAGHRAIWRAACPSVLMPLRMDSDMRSNTVASASRSVLSSAREITAPVAATMRVCSLPMVSSFACESTRPPIQPPSNQASTGSSCGDAASPTASTFAVGK